MGCVPMRPLVVEVKLPAEYFFEFANGYFGLRRDDMRLIVPEIPEIKSAHKRLACRRPLPGEE
ncbi:hypothetical protein LCGC14_0336150 [marine sediment metagenome]|uniref:Uncharacterized protein n=1 Tax=marine sediment metagenome TaxID=412755 RepID=A0A0F9TF13_9ZZZZ